MALFELMELDAKPNLSQLCCLRHPRNELAFSPCFSVIQDGVPNEIFAEVFPVIPLHHLCSTNHTHVDYGIQLTPFSTTPPLPSNEVLHALVDLSPFGDVLEIKQSDIFIYRNTVSLHFVGHRNFNLFSDSSSAFIVVT